MLIRKTACKPTLVEDGWGKKNNNWVAYLQGGLRDEAIEQPKVVKMTLLVLAIPTGRS